MILTEEELDKMQLHNNFSPLRMGDTQDLIDSHRTLNARNAKLVHENDELLAEIEKLKWICKRSSDFIDAMVSFTGGNLQVYGWHLNDSAEPFDNFVEENLEENLVTDLKTALGEVK